MVNNRSINANNSGSKTDKTKSEQNETNMKQQHKGNKVALSKKQRNGQGTNSNIAGETKTKSSSKVIHNSTGSTKSQKPSSTIIFTNSHTINKKGFHTHHLDLQKSFRTTHRITGSSYAQTVGKDSAPVYSNKYATQSDSDRYNSKSNDNTVTSKESRNSEPSQTVASDSLSIAPSATCVKCSSSSSNPGIMNAFNLIGPIIFNNKLYRKSKSYAGGSRATGTFVEKLQTGNSSKQPYRRSSFDRNFAERNKDFVPIVPPARPVLSSSNIAAVIADTEKLTIFELTGKGRTLYPIMQCGTLEAPDSSYHQQRSHRMDVFQIDDGFHSDGGTDTPPPSPSSGSSIASTSDHGSLESVDTGGAQRLAVLSFEQVRKLNDVMDETVAIHGRGNFPTLEVKLKDLVNLVRRKLEADVGSGGAGVIVKDIRLNGGAASHVLASEDQPYNDLDLIYAIELSSSRHFDRVKTAVLNTLLDLLPEGVSKRRIMPCALKEAYVGKMVKVNNNNDGDRWSLISLGNSPGHKNVELKFVDTMRRQFEFSVDSFQIVLDSLLLFYDCATLPISENFYPTVVGESVYGDFQEALYHLQKKLISTRQPEEIRGGGLLKYCNLLVRNYKPVDPQRIKTQERYMCSRFFIDFPDINIQTVKLEAYLRNHFWGIDEEPLQYQYLMHLREVVEMSTVCLMAHERRQTLLLIQSLATQVLYREQQKHQQAQAEEQYHQQQKLHHQQQQKQVAEMKPQSVGVVSVQQQPQQIYLHQQTQQQHQPQSMTTSTALCCPLPSTTTIVDSKQQQQQQQSVTTSSVPQTIHIQAGPPGLIYANGVYYAPVIPTTICTCNSTWLST